MLAGAATGVAGGLALFSDLMARRAESRYPPQGRFLRVRGSDLHYVDRGSGPPVLILHGLDGHVGDFTYALLDTLADDFRVIILERPGSGHSTQPTEALAGIREQARTVADVITALQLDAPLVVGHSFGGAVALALALDFPDLVGGLALVAPLTRPEIRIPSIFKPLAIRSRALRKLFAHTLAVPFSMACSSQMLEQIFEPERAPPDYAAKGGQQLTLRPKSFYTSSTDLTAANDDLPDMVDRYRQLKLPVGVLYGSDDHVLGPSAAWRGAGRADRGPGARTRPGRPHAAGDPAAGDRRLRAADGGPPAGQARRGPGGCRRADAAAGLSLTSSGGRPPRSRTGWRRGAPRPDRPRPARHGR